MTVVVDYPIVLSLPGACAPVEHDFLMLGRFADPARPVRINNRYLELGGRPWFPVMGEFHYSRYPEDEWEVELRRMHAGGIDIVASYVFWNHHEASEGHFDWGGRRNLRRFIELAQQAGLKFFLRPGPWVHAEARNGGFPDWLLPGGAGNGPVRCNDPHYLDRVARFFGQIGAQIRGLLWQDGGPIIGLQLENEYDATGPGRGAEHIQALKHLAIEAGLRVPLYTVTGWPTLDIPVREVVPVSGAYADGFWQATEGPLPPSGVFLFNTSRSIGEMGNVGGTPAAGQIDPHHYPFFLAEAGGGMHVSYHRRPVVSADDVSATALVQIGSGATLYGYYMYHGGTNPTAEGACFHETQQSGYPNDVPVMAYDFRAPLGQYGQERESYGRLRTLHLFLRAFGSELAAMEVALPAAAANDPADRARLRVAARGVGLTGYLFVNNHVRHHPMPCFDGVQFRVQAGDRTIEVPQRPVTIPSGAYFIWPLGVAFGAARLRWATVQPLTRIVEGECLIWVAFSHPQIDPVLCFDARGIRGIDAPDGWVERTSECVWLRPEQLRAMQIVTLTDAEGATHRIVLLPRTMAEQCHRFTLCGRERLVLCEYSAYQNGDSLVVRAPAYAQPRLRVYPADDLQRNAYQLACPDPMTTGHDGSLLPVNVEFDVLSDNPVPPPIQVGPHVSWRKRAVPLAPDDAQFDRATRVRLRMPDGLPAGKGRVMLQIDYIGDAARLYADGELVDDNFNDGEPWFVSVDRYARDGRWPDLELRVIATNPQLPIFLEDGARARLFGAAAARVQRISATPWRDFRFEPVSGMQTVCAEESIPGVSIRG